MRINKIILMGIIGVSFLIVGCGTSQKENVDNNKKDMLMELDGNIEVDVETKNYIKVTSTYPKDIDIVINKKIENTDDIKVFEGKLINNKEGIKVFLESKEDDYYELIANSEAKEERISFSRKIGKVNIGEKDEFFSWDKNSIEYKVDDKISFENRTYVCIKSHTSQESWNPKEAVSLWQEFKY